MGLQVLAYSNLEKGRSQDEKVEEVEIGNTMYRTTQETKTKVAWIHYSGLYLWRNWLSEMVHHTTQTQIWENKRRYQGKPFFTFINHSDCDGEFTTEECRSLTHDFETYTNESKEFISSMRPHEDPICRQARLLGISVEGNSMIKFDRNFWLSFYNELSECFSLGAQNGAVIFC